MEIKRLTSHPQLGNLILESNAAKTDHVKNTVFRLDKLIRSQNIVM